MKYNQSESGRWQRPPRWRGRVLDVGSTDVGFDMTDPLVCFREFLATKGKVLTPERELIAVTALDFDQPIEAERTVFALQKGSKRTVRRSVVYRTLADLQEAGLIQLQEDQPG